MSEKINSYKDLHVYQNAIQLAMEIFEVSKSFPSDEKFSLTDQIRRSSRSVAANLAEAWRKRRYEKAFIVKLSYAESEASETQVWLELAFRCGSLGKIQADAMDSKYEHVLSQIVLMIVNVNKLLIK